MPEEKNVPICACFVSIGKNAVKKRKDGMKGEKTMDKQKIIEELKKHDTTILSFPERGFSKLGQFSTARVFLAAFWPLRYRGSCLPISVCLASLA